MGNDLFAGKDADGKWRFLYGQGNGRGIIIGETGNGLTIIKRPEDPLPPNGGLRATSGDGDGMVRWARDGGLIQGSRGGGKAIRGRGKGKMV